MVQPAEMRYKRVGIARKNEGWLPAMAGEDPYVAMPSTVSQTGGYRGDPVLRRTRPTRSQGKGGDGRSNRHALWADWESTSWMIPRRTCV